MFEQVFRQTKTWVTKRSLGSRRRNERGRLIPRRLLPYVFLAPTVILILLLNILNSSYGVYLSFLDWNYFQLDQRFRFVGLEHYYTVLADPIFYKAVKNTLIWTVVTVPGAFILGLYFALLLNEEIKASALFRTLILLPWAVPLVVVATVWSFIFSPGIGPLNDLLFHLGMHELKYVNWLSRPSSALPIVMGVQIWRWAPFFAITLLAGLQAIPSHLYEAAEIDGASAIERFWHVTLPLLRPVAAVVILQALIWSFHSFTVVFVMTEGGPANATELLTIYLWRNAFPLGQLGKAAAVGTILISFISIIGLVWIIRVLEREED